MVLPRIGIDMTRLSRRAKSLIAALIGCVIALVGAEVTLRLLIASDLVSQRSPFASFIKQVDSLPITASIYRYSDDAVLKLELIPNSRRDHIRTNSAGFRGPEYERAPPPGVTRIALMGDSEVFGAALPEEETLGGALELALNRQVNERRFEVLNFGFPGYNIEQSARLLDQRALEFRPNIVILYYVFNDPQTPGVSEILERKFYYRSYVVLLLRWIYHTHIPGAFYYRDTDRDRIYVEIYKHLHEGDRFAAVSSSIAATGRTLKARGIRFILAVAPELVGYDDFERYPYGEIHKKLGRLETADVEVVDPLPVLVASGSEPYEFWITRTDVHKNGAANTLIAEELAKTVLSEPN